MTVYYVPVQFETYAAVTPEELAREEPIVLKGTDVDLLYKRLEQVNQRRAFIPYRARLRVEPASGKPLYLMDADGNVRCGTREYQLTPRAFLDIVVFLTPYIEARMAARSRKRP